VKLYAARQAGRQAGRQRRVKKESFVGINVKGSDKGLNL